MINVEMKNIGKTVEKRILLSGSEADIIVDLCYIVAAVKRSHPRFSVLVSKLIAGSPLEKTVTLVDFDGAVIADVSQLINKDS